MNSVLQKNNLGSKSKRLHGNSKPFVQAKLTINEPGDIYEQQAYAMADRVMRMTSSETAKPVTGLIGKSLQRKCAHCEEEERKRKPVMRKAEAGNVGMSVSSSFAYSLNASKGGGSPLPIGTRSFMENAFSTDFSGVKIHTGAKATEMSKGINAKAFTYGNDIYFGSGQFSPNSDSGKSLLAHELTHTLQQNSNSNIQRVPMPEESTVNDLESYSAGTRQNIIYDNDFNLQTNLSQFFQKGIVMEVRDNYNVSYVVKGFDPAESWLEPALKAIMLYNFDLDKGNENDAITNITTDQHIDMTGQTKPGDTKVSGPDAVLRFTSTKFDATGKGKALTQNVQLMVEKMGTFSAVASTEKPADRKKRYETTYQITNAVPVLNAPLGDPIEAMSDDKFDMVLQALDKVPAAILSQGTGIPIHRGLSARGPDGEAAEYLQTKAKGSDVWLKRITVYADFFSTTIDKRAFLMAHEFGHALDFRPNEGLKGKGGTSLSSASGKGSFAEALKLDGGVKKGVSTYDLTKTKESEYFAEAFTMYINQPKTLKALRPNVYAYFLAKYP